MAKKKLNIDPNYICAQQPFFSFYPKRIESTQRLNIKQKLGFFPFFPFLYYSFHPKLLVIFSTFVYSKMLSSLKKSINIISILPLI